MRKFSGDRLVLATHNQGKLQEMSALLEPLGLTVLGGGALGLAEPVESGGSFLDNARIKAHAAAGVCGIAALADDSGLEVVALGGKPGVHTADWAETTSGRDFGLAMKRVRQELDSVGAEEPWLARFCCTLVLAWPDGHEESFVGSIDGRIVWPMRGSLGHGFDPVFVPEGHEMTFGEMDRWEKNRMSHRARAVNALVLGCFT